jgi:hypothetical protein
MTVLVIGLSAHEPISVAANRPKALPAQTTPLALRFLMRSPSSDLAASM